MKMCSICRGSKCFRLHDAEQMRRSYNSWNLCLRWSCACFFFFASFWLLSDNTKWQPGAGPVSSYPTLFVVYFSMWLLTPPGAFQKHSTSQTSSWSDSRYVNMPHCFIVFTFGSLHRLFYFILKLTPARAALCRLTWTIVVVILQTQNTEIRAPRYKWRKERRKEGSEGYVPSLGHSLLLIKKK